jgi:hypothetical protein
VRSSSRGPEQRLTGHPRTHPAKPNRGGRGLARNECAPDADRSGLTANSVSRSRKVFLPERRVLLLLLLIVLLFTACGGGPVPPDVVMKIMTALTASAAMANRKSKAGSAFRHYIKRRIMYLGGKNSGWTSESGYTSLTARIGSEMDQVAQFIDERVAALSGKDSVTPSYPNLDDAAKHLATDGPSVISTRAAQFRTDRSERIAQISWRACAIQAELWGGGDSALAPVLQKPGLTEVLDRRLNTVEVMILHDQGEQGSWTIAGAGAGWKDGQRTSMFQYPWVHESPDFTSALTAAGLSIAGLAPTWNEVAAEHDIHYRAMNRPRPPAAADWSPTDQPYRITRQGGAPTSAVMERLIPIEPTTDAAFEDFWQRNWLYCDMMLAALHLHGFRFGRRRRTGSDADFDAVATGRLTLRPLIPKTGTPDPTELFANAPTWFEGVAISHEELQIGDHLVFWNNPFVRHILGSAYGLENSFVTRIAPDGDNVMLAGHGMPEMIESEFKEKMSEEIQEAYRGLRRKINSVLAVNPGLRFFQFNHRGIPYRLIQWAPFGEIFAPSSSAELTEDGAWWIRVKLEMLHDSDEPAPTVAEALASMPKSVRVDPTTHTVMPPIPAVDRLPDYQESIYMPLSTPRGIRGGWAAYLANPTPGGAIELDDLIPDGSMVRGFYAKGPTSTIPVLRPKVHP